MSTVKIFWLPFVAFFAFAGSLAGNEIVLKEGDVWSYQSRPGEEASFLVIRKIEPLPRVGEVVHISLFGLRIKSPGAPGGFSREAGHVPMSGAALRDSLVKKLDRPVPDADWREGYEMWREAKGGVFTKSVRECVDFIEEAINHGKKS